MHQENDPRPMWMVGNRENVAREQAEGREGDGRDPELSGALVKSLQPGSKSNGTPKSTLYAATDRNLPAWGLTLVLVAGWCISALGIGVNFAHTFWEWVPIFVFGGGVPAVFLWQANRILAPRQEPRSLPSAEDKEKELLRALAERGELTPITAAIRISLTADEAAAMLEELAGKGYLQLRVEGGVQAYALGEQDRRELPETPSGTTWASAGADSEAWGSGNSGAPQPLDEDLSERELEVLALLASGRTNSEIAKDLYIAVGTVKTHMNNIYRKLGTRNRAETLARARELKLLP
jgi:DNA-binding NarL/FixJ family response regulator